MMEHAVKPEEIRAFKGQSTMPPVIAAHEVWNRLTMTQQQVVYQELVRMCQQVLAREVHDERPE